MITVDEITMYADPDVIFRTAADVLRWPEILPHYRWVRITSAIDGQCLVEMAARRGLIPVRWTAVQTLNPRSRRICYRHLQGPTQGMKVVWVIEPQGDAVHVNILHEFTLQKPLIRSALATYVIAHCFVKYIAQRTLQCMKRYVETQHNSARMEDDACAVQSSPE
ncbi:MAG: type II toxin-antitoxin system RatA family toxin [Armatimonadota bacterium]